MSWADRARDAIRDITATLPKEATFQQRVKALRDAYPFARREGWAYKAWLKEQRRYLAQFAPPADSKRFPLSPLEKMLLATEQHETRLSSSFRDPRQ